MWPLLTPRLTLIFSRKQLSLLSRFECLFFQESYLEKVMSDKIMPTKPKCQALTLHFKTRFSA